MTVHLYLSLVPEALVASMLEPEAFGAYYAVGTLKKSSGQALFVELDPAFRHPAFRIDEAITRCVPHPNGDPKCSIYIAVYRVLERVPVSALGSLYLVTHDGRVAGLSRRSPAASVPGGLHLYQEICPVNPMVASTYEPVSYYRFMTDRANTLFALPALAFADLKLAGLETDPENGDAGELPYPKLDHLRSCLVELRTKRIGTKMVDRNPPVRFPYRVVNTGFYFGQGPDLAFYPMPSKEDLLGQHFAWWRSAQM